MAKRTQPSTKTLGFYNGPIKKPKFGTQSWLAAEPIKPNSLFLVLAGLGHLGLVGLRRPIWAQITVGISGLGELFLGLNWAFLRPFSAQISFGPLGIGGAKCPSSGACAAFGHFKAGPLYLFGLLGQHEPTQITVFDVVWAELACPLSLAGLN